MGGLARASVRVPWAHGMIHGQKGVVVNFQSDVILCPPPNPRCSLIVSHRIPGLVLVAVTGHRKSGESATFDVTLPKQQRGISASRLRG